MKHSRQGLDGRSLKLFSNRVAFLTLLLSFLFMLVVSMGAVQAFAASSECTRTYDGDLIVEGNRELEITGETVCVHGNITVKDNAKLTITNATLRIFGTNRRIEVQDSACLTLDHVNIETPDVSVTDEPLFLDANGEAKIKIQSTNTSIGKPISFNRVEGHSQVSIRDSSLTELQIFNQADVAVARSKILGRVNLFFDGPNLVEVTGLKPGHIDHWEFDGSDEGAFHLSIHDAEIESWLVGVGDKGDVVIKDCVLSGLVLTPNGISGTLSGLHPGTFSSWSLHENNDVNCTVDVRLVNTSIRMWFLHFSNGARLAIHDSNLVHIAVDNGYADMTLRDVRVGWLTGQDAIGKIDFDGSSITQAIDFNNAMLTLTGNVSISPDCYVNKWRNSTIIRDFPVVLEKDFDTPASQMPIEITLPNGRKLNQTTDDNGRMLFQCTFTDSTYQDTCQLQVTTGSKEITHSVGFLSSSPVSVWLNEFPGTKSLVPYDGLVISLPGTYEFKAGKFHLDDSNHDGHIILINSDDVTLIGHDTTLIGGEDYTFDTPYDVVGIQMHDRHNITIEGFTIMNYAIGIQSTGDQSHVTVRNNSFFDNSRRAVEIIDWDYLPFPPQRNQARSNNILIENNYVVGNTKIPTRVVEGKTLPCRYKELEEEGAAASCTGIFGLYWYGLRDSVMRGNTVKNTTLSGLRLEMIQNCVIGNNLADFSYLALWTYGAGPFLRSDNIYRNNEITNSVVGLGAGQNGRNNLYEDNDLHDNLYGMYILGQIDPSKYHFGNQTEEVANNKMYNNVLAGIGASLDWPSAGSDFNAYIQGNTIFGNGQYGIAFERGSGHVSISNNEIYGNGQDGIILQSTPVVTINGNNIHDNGEWGILAYSKTCCPYCQDARDQFEGKITLEDNTIANNGKGPTCGLHLEETSP